MKDGANIVPLFVRDGDGGTKRQLGEAMRIAEAIVFASAEPVAEADIARHLPDGVQIGPVMRELQALYAGRGVSLVRAGSAWAFRTAPDLGHLLARETSQRKRLSSAALEVLAIIAYHQPVTRAEIDDIRGVETSRGTLDILLEAEWVRMRGRRRTVGRPVTYATTDAFLDHFGLEGIGDLPGVDELRGAGLLSARLPAYFSIPEPRADGPDANEDEDRLAESVLEELGLLPPKAGDR